MSVALRTAPAVNAPHPLIAAPVLAQNVPTELRVPRVKLTASGGVWLNTPHSGDRSFHYGYPSLDVAFTGKKPEVLVHSIRVFERGTNKLVKTLSDPTAWANDQSLDRRFERRYRFDVPRNQIHANKRYTFVFDASVNGQRGLLRTAFTPPHYW